MHPLLSHPAINEHTSNGAVSQSVRLSAWPHLASRPTGQARAKAGFEDRKKRLAGRLDGLVNNFRVSSAVPRNLRSPGATNQIGVFP